VPDSLTFEIAPVVVEEQKLNKNERHWLKEQILQHDDEYSLSDYEYLQGESIAEKRWLGKRIEIDAIHVQYGIRPFIDYILKKIEEECTVWDLTRIGVEKFELREPTNLYEKDMANYESEAWKPYRKKQDQIEVPIRNIIGVTKDVFETIKQPFESLKKKYWRQGYVHHELKGADYNQLKMDFKDQIDKKWTEEDDVQLSFEEINDQIECYEGDVREGKEDLRSQIRDLEADVREKQSEDEDLKPFGKRLKKIGWGKEELSELKAPGEAELIHQVIEALQERLMVIDNDNISTGGNIE